MTPSRPEHPTAAPARLLVVDDDRMIRQLLQDLLGEAGYEVRCAADGEDALALASADPPDVVLMDLVMPGIDGVEATRRLRAQPQTRAIPIVMISSAGDTDNRVRAIDAGADDFLSKPFEQAELMARVASSVKIRAFYRALHDQQAVLEQAVHQRTRELHQAIRDIQHASLEMVLRLCRAAESKDQVTGQHIQRMSAYSYEIALALGCGPPEAEALRHTAPMHDVGKIGIPDQILLKPGRLEGQEWEVMKSHATIGARILEGSALDVIRIAERIARTHHERWDGGGYPEGLAAEAIPLEGRIVAVADVYDAMTSPRPYRSTPYTRAEALAYITGARGKHFDPDVVDAFLRVVQRNGGEQPAAAPPSEPPPRP